MRDVWTYKWINPIDPNPDQAGIPQAAIEIRAIVPRGDPHARQRFGWELEQAIRDMIRAVGTGEENAHD